MKIIIILLTALLFCNFAAGQTITDSHARESISINNGDYTTDKYSYKFQGHWLWESWTSSFEIVFERQITDFNRYHKMDGMHCWIKYVRNGVVVVDNIKNRTFRYTNVATGDPAITLNIFTEEGRTKIKEFSGGSGKSLSEYVLEINIRDDINKRRYTATITMDPTNNNAN